MSRGFPSMTALLGLLAIAGYQNRDKIAELLRGAQRNPGAVPSQGPQSGSAGGAIPGNLGGMLGGTSIGDMLMGFAIWLMLSNRKARVKWRTHG